MCHKLSKDQFYRYNQNLDESTIKNTIWEIQFYYRQVHKEDIPVSILKIVKNDPLD